MIPGKPDDNSIESLKKSLTKPRRMRKRERGGGLDGVGGLRLISSAVAAAPPTVPFCFRPEEAFLGLAIFGTCGVFHVRVHLGNNFEKKE